MRCFALESAVGKKTYDEGKNAMEKLKVGVIGCVHMGSHHVRNYSMELGYFNLIGVYDTDMKQAEKVANQYSTKAFGDIDLLLSAVDAVSVAVPSSLHKEIGLKVAQHNVHALIEKPIALNNEEAQILCQAFEEKNLKLQVGHIERFNPVITELEKFLDKDKIFFIEAHRYGPFSGNGRITDTSVVEDLLIHDIDLVCHIMAGIQVTDVRANGEKIQSNNIDFVTSMLNFGECAHAIINASRVSQNKERTICIHTKDSCIYADLLTRTLTISKETDLTIDGSGDSSYRQNGIVQKIFVPIQEPLRRELLSFYSSIIDGTPIVVTGQMGINAIRICEKVIDRINNQICGKY